ncbi:trxA [Acrasis kona]|uniref:Thioredoxin n=1 Tax=Acrasis kona TaxID=1008807 RepID=A0AAW2Z107_9EUKA
MQKYSYLRPLLTRSNLHAKISTTFQIRSFSAENKQVDYRDLSKTLDESKGNVLLYLHCTNPPSKQMTPIVHKVFSDFDGRYSLIKCCVDGELAQEYVEEKFPGAGLPLLVCYKDGERIPIEHSMGFKIEQMVKDYVRDGFKIPRSVGK